jgi:hypothetical protein
MAQFLFECPDGFDGAAELMVGNRIAFAGDLHMLMDALADSGSSAGASASASGGTTASTSAGVWAIDQSTSSLHILSDSMPTEVYVPTVHRLVTIEGKANVALTGITFADTDFIASGKQVVQLTT